MAFQGFGFGRTSGPHGPREFKFGNFPSSSPPPASPPFNNDNNTPPPPPRFETGSGFITSVSKTPQRVPSPHLAFARDDFADGLRRPHEEAQRPAIFPPQWETTPRGGNSNFPTHQRPSPVTQGNFPTNQRPSPVAQGNFPTHQRPSPVAQRPSLVAQGNFPTYQRQSPVAQGIASFSAGTSVPTKPASFQGSKRTRSPPSSNPLLSENLNQHVNGRDSVIPQRLQISYEDLDHPSEEDQRFLSQPSNFQAPKRTRSPPILPANKVHWRNSNPSQDDVDRAFTSHQSLDNRSVLQTKNANSPSQRSSPFSPDNAEGTGAKATNSQVAKRSRSPPLSSTEEVFRRTSYSSQHDEEREMQAKAKRLARFGAELSQPMQINLDHLKHKVPESRNDQTFEDRQKVVARQSMEVGEDVMLPDHEGLESSNIIIGLCPDMCPESEREERERKGDLDRYERFDGDRNQTSKSLAVKKYTRTAEREAILIRPMPVLQKTIDYLLSLLDQPYDDRFLGMYNFLWDRMRAIRMDLRMQHLFDQDAITMLEQMIRLHIIAMHELCEYTKGEGFSEGFDAHLNIEQMNKTSVELFQLYDDHRKKGTNVPSEKEFRGYYALLKLDKHPGYKVEPAELSLDLAKMTPEIRQTPEILFARDVARACRTCNFIAFFRLARKATYLQACLMHAHFAKLRTQALASLHSGLQSNQGIPLSQVAKWLGMEEDDIESLVEYHGFLIKEFEEPYMVKEGPFLNSDKDYQTKCSQLVHLKKSRSISEDVSSSGQSVWPTEESKQENSDKKNKSDSKAIEVVKSKVLVDVFGKEMFDFEQVHTPIQGSRAQSRLVPFTTCQKVETDHQVAGFWGVASLHQPPHSPSSKVGLVGKPVRETIRMRPSVQGAPFQFGMGGFPKTDGYTSSMESAPKTDRYISSMESHLENPAVERVVTENPAVERVVTENPAAKRIVIETQDNDRDLVAHHEIEDETAMVLPEEVDNEDDFNIQLEREIATVKLKLIIRKWRRCSLKRKELREQRQVAAKAALSSLSLGIPIQRIKSQPSHVGELDINQVVRERHERQRRSWSRLNVSEVVAEILRERNTDAKCICWKLIVCSEMKTTLGNGLLQGSQSDHLASRWLHHKLMGAIDENDDELVLSYTGLSIWKKWVTSQYHSPPTCCLSVIREANFGNFEDTVGGASAILFLLSESISWEAQKSQLHNLVMSLPSGSCVPLLILSGTYKEQIINPSLIADKLGLNFMYKTRISTFSVLTFFENHSPGHLDGFFSDDCLRQGIQWLASNSPLQPVLHCTRTRELVMDHLSSSLDMLEKVDVSEVSPDTCISVFNKALEQSEEEVSIAADANPTGWPCPEIELLEELSDEHRAVDLWLPCVGCSSAATIVPILGGIRSCKLPTFIDDLSWLNAGSEMGKEILNQKTELEKCLFRYLAQSSKILDASLAMTEAYVMLQKGATIELQGSNYRIKPRWVSIFRRIFNWQLMNLSTGIPSVAYVLKHQRAVEPHNMATLPNFGTREVNQQATLTIQDLGSINLQSERSPASSLAQPSLDEMIEVCCNTRLSSREEFEALDAPTLSCKMVDHDKLQLELDPMQDHPRVVVANEEKKEADKLNQLLEQCNMLMDMIDVKLSIYGYDT